MSMTVETACGSGKQLTYFNAGILIHEILYTPFLVTEGEYKGKVMYITEVDDRGQVGIGELPLCGMSAWHDPKILSPDLQGKKPKVFDLQYILESFKSWFDIYFDNKKPKVRKKWKEMEELLTERYHNPKGRWEKDFFHDAKTFHGEEDLVIMLENLFEKEFAPFAEYYGVFD